MNNPFYSYVVGGIYGEIDDRKRGLIIKIERIKAKALDDTNSRRTPQPVNFFIDSRIMILNIFKCNANLVRIPRVFFFIFILTYFKVLYSVSVNLFLFDINSLISIMGLEV